MNRFEDAYEGTPPWDIGRPQRAFVPIASQNLRGPVLDAGCGTGEHSILFAQNGFEVLGLDFAPRAIEKARAKIEGRKLNLSFLVGDALALDALGRTFGTVIDCGLFHVFEDADRARYVTSLSKALVVGGRYLMLAFSDEEPTEWGGPRRVRRDEIESSFGAGWAVRSIVPVKLETTFHENGGGNAWFADIERTG